MHIVELMVAMPFPQIDHEIVEVIQLASQERFSESIVEQTVDVPVPPVHRKIVKVVM